MATSNPGKRVDTTSKSTTHKRRILPIAVVGSFTAVYLGVCVYASQGTILPGTTISGIDVGNMTFESAHMLLEASLPSLYTNQELSIQIAGSDVAYSFNGDGIEPELDLVLSSAIGSDTPFIAQGVRFIKGLLQKPTFDADASFTLDGEYYTDSVLDTLMAELGGSVKQTSWQIVDDQLIVTVGAPGHSFDVPQIKSDILNAFSRLDSTPLVLAPLDVDPDPIDFSLLHQELATTPVDASFNEETYEIVPSVSGIDFDPAHAAAIAQDATWDSTLSIPLTITLPNVLTQDFDEFLFQDLLGVTTTYISGDSGRFNNVKVAAASCHDIILLPGDVFSYNDATGLRIVSNGYQMGTAYVAGESVTVVGGGICQVSSSIYYSALKSNLKIVERQNHSYAVGYVPDGADATVYGTTLDFKFENDTDYPIKILCEVEGRNMSVSIYGTKVDDVTSVITFKEISRQAYETIYQVDPSLTGDQTTELVSPYTARTVQSYRNLYNGEAIAENLISSTLEATNVYKRRDRVVAVSPEAAGNYGLEVDPSLLPEVSVDDVTDSDELVTDLPLDYTGDETTPTDTTPTETTPDVVENETTNDVDAPVTEDVPVVDDSLVEHDTPVVEDAPTLDDAPIVDDIPAVDDSVLDVAPEVATDEPVATEVTPTLTPPEGIEF